MNARPVRVWSVLWADGRLPGVVFATYAAARAHAAKLRRSGVQSARIARVEIREVAE